MKIKIEKALKMLEFTEKAKQNKSEFGLNSLLLHNEILDKLRPFRTREFNQHVQLGVKVNGKFEFSPETEITFNNWYNKNIQDEIEITPRITKDITPIDDRIDFIEMCNGILCEVDLQKFVTENN